jgi:predicted metalloenzyme YecM
MNKSQFYSEAQTFLKDLFNDMNKANIRLEDHWEIDHLCFRSDSAESYESLKKEFLNFGKLLIESEVNGRMISTFKLDEPVFYNDWMIDLIELPAPKKGKVTRSGFEHIEVVCDMTFPELIQRYSHVELDQKGLTKDYNQELELCLGERNIKFHHTSLESVVTLEGHEDIWKTIRDSNILSLLKEDGALIAGDLPLNLSEKAEVKILVNSSKDKLQELFSQMDQFNLSESPELVCHFILDSVHFEIHSEKTEPLKQAAYIQYQIHERLLKYGGDALRKKVIQEKKKGSSTEEAFEQVLPSELKKG